MKARSYFRISQQRAVIVTVNNCHPIIPLKDLNIVIAVDFYFY